MLPSLIAVLVLVCLWPTNAGAYAVGSGFSDPCHERITLDAYKDFVVDLPTGAVPIPTGPAWKRLSAAFIEKFHLEAFNEAQQVLILSLVVGVRAPDTDGHALTNLNNTRRIHADPSAVGQYAHSLRGPDDDGAGGDAMAIAGTRALIKDAIALVQESLDSAPSRQLIDAPVYLDFYGRFDVPVWAPMFHIGRAVHAVQDSFSHTLRSNDLRRIRHVMNYVEAISSNYSEERDGIRHSGAMDHCDRATAPIVTGAREATIDLILTATAPFFLGKSPKTIDGFLDQWFVLEPRCEAANNYCDSPFLKVARSEPTKSYLGCSVAGPSSLAAALPFALLGMLGLMRRLLRRPSVVLLAAIAAIGSLTGCGPDRSEPVESGCESFAACGGDLVGVWGFIQNDCDVRLGIPRYAGAVAACEGLTAKFQNAQAGVIELSADGAAVLSGAFRQRARFEVPKRCLRPPLPAASACDAPQSDLSPLQDLLAETSLVCADRGTICLCSATDVPQPPDALRTRYRTDGGMLILGDGEATSIVGYCVRGELLDLQTKSVDGTVEQRGRLQRL